MKKPLDARTLRLVVRRQRARMKRNVQFWAHSEWMLMEDFLRRLTRQARTLERKTKAVKR